MAERPTWCEYFAGIADATATRADCIRRKVGAVFTYKNRVVSTGYNGTRYPGEEGCLSGACPRGQLTYEEQPAFADYGNCIANHAEANGLLWLVEHSNLQLDQVTVHITCQPCPHCQVLLDTFRIRICYPGKGEPCPITQG